MEAVASATAQDVRNHRVVVVTDGQRDIPPLGDDLLVLGAPRSGIVGVVRNFGLRSTRSRLVAFLDDDNTWHRDHLEHALRALDSADVVYASANRVRPDGSIYDTIGGAWGRERLRHANYIDASAIVARRSPGLRFSRANRVGCQFSEDWELMWRLGRRRRIAWTGEITVDYALSPGLEQVLDGLKAAAARAV